MKKRTYHMAAKVNDKGDMSALCFSTTRAIDLRKASWTLRDEAVTCRRCRKIIAEPRVTYPPEMLPRAEPGDDAVVIFDEPKGDA